MTSEVETAFRMLERVVGPLDPDNPLVVVRDALDAAEARIAELEAERDEERRRCAALRQDVFELEQAADAEADHADEMQAERNDAKAALAVEREKVGRLMEALRDLYAYVVELEKMHSAAVLVRGGKFPDGAEALGDRVRAILSEVEGSGFAERLPKTMEEQRDILERLDDGPPPPYDGPPAEEERREMEMDC